jgi:hypothetical protein
MDHSFQVGAGHGPGRVERTSEQSSRLLTVERPELDFGTGEDLGGLVGRAGERDLGELGFA